jgi:hypothetical protein
MQSEPPAKSPLHILLLREPKHVRSIERSIEELRKDLLCDVDEAGASDSTRQYFLLALSGLEQAQRFARLATLQARIARSAETAWPPKEDAT